MQNLLVMYDLYMYVMYVVYLSSIHLRMKDMNNLLNKS